MSVEPPSYQSRRWCQLGAVNGTSHLTHPLSRTAATSRWAWLTKRWLRPSHNVRPLSSKMIPHTEESGERLSRIDGGTGPVPKISQFPSGWNMYLAVTHQLDQTLTRRKQIETQLTQELKTNPLGQVLATIPGFGPRTTPKTLTEIGNPHRFPNGAKLASYASLAPTNRRAGRTLNTTTHN